jgi:AmmeMemoRadiSam system protein B
LNWEELDGDRACGCRPIGGLLCVAKERSLRCRTVDLRNSGDTSGGRGRVVGYGAFVFTEN